MHEIISEAEKILDKKYSVLDKGFVRLVDYMGGDSSVVQAARISYGKGTKTVSKDRGLIRYLMRNEHTSPFEMVELKFHCKMPIFVARQWVRHRTASLNEVSGRYSEMKNEFYIPEPEQINPQSESNKQGRSEKTFPEEKTKGIISSLKEEQMQNYQNYKNMVDEGIARELARINLPLSLYTEWYWKIDLHNLFHFLELRTDKNAQYEIREYANVIFDITKKVAPLSCEAFEDYGLNSVKFSKQEIELLKGHIEGINQKELSSLSPGERREFQNKLQKLIKNSLKIF